MTQETLKLALDALEEAHEIEFWNKQAKAITAIKEALAQLEQDGKCKYCTHGCAACDARRQSNVLP